MANNEDSSFIAVMKKTHQKSDGTYVDERACLVAEKYDAYVQERLSLVEASNGEVLTEPLTVEERNEIYVKVIFYHISNLFFFPDFSYIWRYD